MSKQDGGPAFPVPETNDYMPSMWGMSLRDYFAGQALAGWLASYGPDNSCDDVSRDGAVVFAYEVADAMLAERAKGTA